MLDRAKLAAKTIKGQYLNNYAFYSDDIGYHVPSFMGEYMSIVGAFFYTLVRYVSILQII